MFVSRNPLPRILKISKDEIPSVQKNNVKKIRNEYEKK